MKSEINISVSSNSKKTVEELIEEWGNSTIEIEGTGFLNANNQIKGIFVHKKGDPSNIIDIFLKPQFNDKDKEIE
jgi:hypothetical protein